MTGPDWSGACGTASEQAPAAAKTRTIPANSSFLPEIRHILPPLCNAWKLAENFLKNALYLELGWHFIMVLASDKHSDRGHILL
jgi:hypothetical protein